MHGASVLDRKQEEVGDGGEFTVLGGSAGMGLRHCSRMSSAYSIHSTGTVHVQYGSVQYRYPELHNPWLPSTPPPTLALSREAGVNFNV